MKYNHIIAIDPDCLKSGVARLSLPPITKLKGIYNMEFPQLIEFLRDMHNDFERPLVVVEAGWLNESNWHLKPTDSKALVAKKGNAVGRNHETGRKIVEMCKYYGIHVEEVKPLVKCWRGPDHKITHEEIAYFIPDFPTRSNQETRDAALLAWNHAGLPMRVAPIKSKTNVK